MQIAVCPLADCDSMNHDSLRIMLHDREEKRQHLSAVTRSLGRAARAARDYDANALRANVGRFSRATRRRRSELETRRFEKINAPRASPSSRSARCTHQRLRAAREKATLSREEAHLTGALGHGRFDAGAKMTDKRNGPSGPSLAARCSWEIMHRLSATPREFKSRLSFAVAKCQGFQRFSEIADATWP